MSQDFKLLEKLGEGGMGQVFRARQVSLDRPVAFKTLSADMFENPEALLRFRREMLLLSKLSHPHVVRVLESGLLAGRPFFTMDLIEGSTLKDIVAESGPMAPERALRLIRQLSSAIEYLHQQGIAHRDIKPKNLILDSKGPQDHLMVVDFGLARAYSAKALTQRGHVLGSIPYLSPEVLSQEADGFPRDIWALGAIAVELHQGHRLFQGSAPSALVDLILDYDPGDLENRLPGVSRDLRRLIQSCLARDPAARPDAADLHRALRAI